MAARGETLFDSDEEELVTIEECDNCGSHSFFSAMKCQMCGISKCLNCKNPERFFLCSECNRYFCFECNGSPKTWCLDCVWKKDTIEQAIHHAEFHESLGSDQDCIICAMLDCTFDEPFHYGSDGCPSCLFHQTEAGA